MSDIQPTDDGITLAIARIEDPATPIDEIADTLNKIDFAMERAKALKANYESAMTARIKAVGKPIQIGKWLWALKTPKTTSCPSNREAVEACLNACNGDLDQFSGLLGSDPFKHGACSKILPPEVYESVFVTTYPDKLDKKLVKLDVDFVPKRGGAGTPQLQNCTQNVTELHLHPHT
jgi:hypothetical protein